LSTVESAYLREVSCKRSSANLRARGALKVEHVAADELEGLAGFRLEKTARAMGVYDTMVCDHEAKGGQMMQ
jgi:hypothetical protein